MHKIISWWRGRWKFSQEYRWFVWWDCWGKSKCWYVFNL